MGFGLEGMEVGRTGGQALLTAAGDDAAAMAAAGAGVLWRATAKARLGSGCRQRPCLGDAAVGLAADRDQNVAPEHHACKRAGHMLWVMMRLFRAHDPHLR